MSMLTASVPQTAAGDGSGQPLLDFRHLHHQTLGDATLRCEVLQLFLAEAPKYIADLRTAHDAKAWRMAVHTLKGVALNIGAFALAQSCRSYELSQTPAFRTNEAADVLAALIAQTSAAVKTAIGPDPRPLPGH